MKYSLRVKKAAYYGLIKAAAGILLVIVLTIGYSRWELAIVSIVPLVYAGWKIRKGVKIVQYYDRHGNRLV